MKSVSCLNSKFNFKQYLPQPLLLFLLTGKNLVLTKYYVMFLFHICYVFIHTQLKYDLLLGDKVILRNV